MQERYLGDVHDFMKYAFIRYLAAETDMRPGLNWYLTHPDRVDAVGNSDGNQRYHLGGGVWAGIDGKLVTALEQFNDAGARRIAAFEGSGILPAGTLYHPAEVPHEERAGWHIAARAALGAADFVFLDPDNGFVVPSASRRRLPKYALYEEVTSWLESATLVTCIQFARQCKPQARAGVVVDALKSQGFGESILPVLRCRVSPNLLLVSLARPEVLDHMTALLQGFAERGRDKVEVIWPDA